MVNQLAMPRTWWIMYEKSTADHPRLTRSMQKSMTRSYSRYPAMAATHRVRTAVWPATSADVNAGAHSPPAAAHSAARSSVAATARDKAWQKLVAMFCHSRCLSAGAAR
jgi:hypothetical protein